MVSGLSSSLSLTTSALATSGRTHSCEQAPSHFLFRQICLCADHSCTRPSLGHFSSPLSSGRRLSFWCRCTPINLKKFNKLCKYICTFSTAKFRDPALHLDNSSQRCFCWEQCSHCRAAELVDYSAHPALTVHVLGIFRHSITEFTASIADGKPQRRHVQ